MLKELGLDEVSDGVVAFVGRSSVVADVLDVCTLGSVEVIGIPGPVAVLIGPIVVIVINVFVVVLVHGGPELACADLAVEFTVNGLGQPSD